MNAHGVKFDRDGSFRHLTDGALWIGGRFRDSMTIRDQQDQELIDWCADASDGYLLRFELPEP